MSAKVQEALARAKARAAKVIVATCDPKRCLHSPLMYPQQIKHMTRDSVLV